MDFSLIAIDVDGSLANPVMQAAVIVYAVALATPLVVIFARLSSTRDRLLGTLVVLGLGCVTSPLANRVIGMLIYQIISKPGVSVGFFGSPPFFASPILAVAIGCVVGSWIRTTPRVSVRGKLRS